MTEFTWSVKDAAGQQVASGSALDYDSAAREATRYAMQYGQDGPVRYWIKQGRTYMLRAYLGGVKIRQVAIGEAMP